MLAGVIHHSCAKLLIFLFLVAAHTSADEIRPAYLYLKEADSDTYKVVWKVPALSDNRRLALDVVFDRNIEMIRPPIGGFVGRAHIQNWTIATPNGLHDTSIIIEGLESSSSEVLLRIEYLNGKSLITRLTPSSPSYKIGKTSSLAQVIKTYFLLGVEHILIGIDHLLFILVLLLLVKNTRKLIITISAFTVAHSVTLSLATLNIIHVPVPPVESCIALSILFVCAEIIRSKHGDDVFSENNPGLVAFSFGLLHGLGFAAALNEIGLPQTAIPAALLFFNIGVEAGQLIFVIVMLTLWRIIGQKITAKNPWIQQAPVYIIGSVAAFWVIERTARFLA